MCIRDRAGDDDQAVGGVLGRLLFAGDDVRKAVRVLSGGERHRMSFGRLMLGRHNVMMMDEPTNHLDMESIESLQLALEKYPGTLFVVSHDRQFVDAIATRVLEGDARTWAEIASDLQARLVELTHSVELSFLDATEAAPETIAPERALGFERAVLEAVRNAVRHSRANKVEVRLLAGQTLRAEVRDDGTGLPPECFDRETGGIIAVGRGVDDAELPEQGAATEARLERKARFHAELTPTVGGFAVERLRLAEP